MSVLFAGGIPTDVQDQKTKKLKEYLQQSETQFSIQSLLSLTTSS